MRMNDIVTIDTIVFEIVRGGGAFKALPPPRIVNFLKNPGSDRVNDTHPLIRHNDYCKKF